MTTFSRNFLIETKIAPDSSALKKMAASEEARGHQALQVAIVPWGTGLATYYIVHAVSSEIGIEEIVKEARQSNSDPIQMEAKTKGNPHTILQVYAIADLACDLVVDLVAARNRPLVVDEEPTSPEASRERALQR